MDFLRFKGLLKKHF